MRPRVPWILISILRIAAATDDEYSPYSNPLFGLSDDALLVKRQGCEAGLNSCSGLGADNVCCPSDTTCALDQAGHVACCPSNAVCTGTIAGSITGSATGSGSESGIGTTTSTGVVTFTGVVGGGSTVTNPYYPFVYAPTSFPNADLCSSAYTSCQSASTACFTSLAGANGVTIGGLGGGITVQGVSGTILSSASSICSSLSSVGCSGLQQVSQCTIFGSGSGVVPTTTAGTSGIIQVGNNGPRRTACPGMLYAAGAGAAIGAMRGII
ncbi:uncharacterized protein PV07_03160 [Cladophialophora immunda]|uniref:Hydrophobin n=1 Tax=Cladophialophora immunda TaxID=569365 RepID=A0A0D2CNF4_9EURO|nr:uncharacterized protein PV07_03160 [Cladophialophora immunda]KIW31515.1 hypothetical protein PV07_03160 [Cladophialophora immunda]